MIFSAPRFIVVDDKETHLRAITDTFHRIGTPCLGLLYSPEEDFDQKIFRGVRVLFMDLHLLDGQVGTDERRHYSLIASILEDNINKNGGPFVLVVWTAHEHLSAGLEEYIDQGIDVNKPYARPIAVLCLAKEKFIGIDSGDVTDPENLRHAVLETIFSNPQLAALLSWESDVLAAAGDTLASLVNLVPADKRARGIFPAALDIILSRLARDTVGKINVDVNPRAAILMALAPILSDRILNQDVAEETHEIWRAAVTRHGDSKLEPASPVEAGEINRILHLAVPGSETLRPTDWGAVIEWPFKWADDELECLTGLTIKQMLCDEFRMRSSAIEVCKPVLVRVGAACDYAQNNRGPITFLFGMDIPESAERQKDKNNCPVKMTDAVWKSPLFLMSGAAEASRLHVHIRFPQTHLPEVCWEWKACYRLREQLLMHLIIAASNHAARPGVVQLGIA